MALFCILQFKLQGEFSVCLAESGRKNIALRKAVANVKFSEDKFYKRKL